MKGEAPKSPWRAGRLVVLLAFLLILAGCGNVQLYTNQPEQTINEMLALLLHHGLPAHKKPGEKGTWNLVVKKEEFAAAMDVLLSYGYPQDEYDSMGEVFKRQGLVSSPREERVRFMHALSQSLAKTISKIDGVSSARVHLVIPEPNPLLDTQLPSSAAVFVKHSHESNIGGFIPQIKQLVQHSIPGLAYEKISVVLFPAEDPTVVRVPIREPSTIMGIQVHPGSVSMLRMLLSALVGLLLASWAALGYIWLRSAKTAARVQAETTPSKR